MHASLSRFSRAVGIIAAAAVGLVAQEASEPPVRAFIVTASRVEEDALEAPAQTIVITAEEIAASGAANLPEALARTAGVVFRSTSSEAQAEISMRGFGENSSGRVLVLVDGRHLNNPDMQAINWLAVPLADVERIEVLHGASSVRYGSGAVGGVVNIITKQARKGMASEAGLSVGSFGENRQRYSLDIGGERAGITASAEQYGTDGYRDRTGYRSAAAAVRGYFDIADALTLTAGASLSDVFYEMPGGLLEAAYEDDPSAALNYEDEAREGTYTAELGVEWNPTEAVSARMPLFYSYKNIASDMESWTAFTDRSMQTVQASPLAVWNSAAGFAELRLTGGADFSAALLAVDTYGEKERTTKTNAFEVSQFSIGPFLTLRATVFEVLSLEGGLRYDRSTITAENRDGSVDGDVTHEAVVYDAGVVYRPIEGTKVYARYGTLFRYPFTDEQASLYGFGGDVLLTDLEAEKGFNLEGGFSIALGKVATLDASIYMMEMNDEIAYNGSTFRNENLDATARVGGDAALRVAPLAFLELEGAYGYVDARFVDGANEDERVPLVSEHQVDAALTLKAPFGLSATGTASFRSEAFQGGDFANAQAEIPAFAVYGLTIRFVPEAFGGNLEFTAKVENLLDEGYAPYQYYGWTGADFGTSYYPATGRGFSLGARYRY